MKHFPVVYIVAVSGGVDSCVLLDMLVKHDPAVSSLPLDDSQFVVAHANHGIRGEPAIRDQEFVRNLAEHYSLKFETADLHLGEDASEERARNARYEFFDEILNKYHAKGLILAHHAGDVIETAIINFVRGTGRRGLSSLASTDKRIRPLLRLNKDDILEYAKRNHLDWVEDETNQKSTYLRNRIRTKLKSTNAKDLNEFATELQKVKEVNTQLDNEIAKILQYRLRDKYILSRSWFVKIPHDIACEVMHAVLTKLQIAQIDRPLVEKLVIALKVAKPGSRFDVDKETVALVTKRSLRFINRENLKTRTV